jgi:hypothetical protein
MTALRLRATWLAASSSSIVSRTLQLKRPPKSKRASVRGGSLDYSRQGSNNCQPLCTGGAGL